jgi:hypothetical protein
MLKYSMTFVAGFVCASLVFIFVVLPKENSGQFEYGYDNGVIGGRMQAADAIQNEFGTYDKHSAYKVLFSVHTADVVSIETNGVKTVRVIP